MVLAEIEAAEKRIRPYILTTPLVESRELSRLTGGKVLLKLESEQHTGSFKARGSLNKILSLSEREKSQGVITASTGNHALGFARALEIGSANGSVYLPENASQAKIKALEYYDVELLFHGKDSLSAEMHAREQARQQKKVWVSPYNDPKVIGGQGTIGIELMEGCDQLDQVLVTIGGGGLISGIGSWLKSKRPRTRIIGCQPANAPEMTMSLEAGRIIGLDQPMETLSDGSAGGIEEGSITFPICQEVVDDSILVSEEEIAKAIKFMAMTHHKIVEGAAGVAVASLLKHPDRFKDQTVAIIICGSNISFEKFLETVVVN